MVLSSLETSHVAVLVTLLSGKACPKEQLYTTDPAYVVLDTLNTPRVIPGGSPQSITTTLQVHVNIRF